MRNPTIEIVERDMAAVLRTKTEAQRLRIAWDMWRSAQSMLDNLLRAEHRDWDDARRKKEIARRLSHGTT